MNSKIHKPHACPYCWRVCYSKSALSAHINKEHWVEKKEAEENVESEDLTENEDAE